MTNTHDTVTEHARAKVNLSLHVTGQRADGYHLLDSLVMFTSAGDVVTVEPAKALTLRIDGPFADGLATEDDNLVLRAARLMGDQGAIITLTKNLPVSSGIGGGSADAAATCRALSRLWGVPLPNHMDLLTLGADVPVCMTSELTVMRGIGEDLETLGPAPMLDVLLVNPGVAVSTPEVFRGLGSKTNPAMTTPMPDPFDTEDWLGWLAHQRNDLEKPARAATPEVGIVLDALVSQAGCQLARMSGSGATCFAIFEDHEACALAASTLKAANPSWWVMATDEAPI